MFSEYLYRYFRQNIIHTKLNNKLNEETHTHAINYSWKHQR